MSGKLTVGELEQSSQVLLYLVFVLIQNWPLHEKSLYFLRIVMEEVKGEEKRRSLAIISVL